MEKAPLRIIDLCDYNNHLLVETDVPSEIIEQAIAYKNQKLIEEEYNKTDFEYMEDYIWSVDEGFTFSIIGDLNDLPSYNW